MATLEYSEIRSGKIILHDDEPCEVIDSHVARTQQRKPQNQVKLRSLISGKVFPATYHVSDKADEADIEKRDVKFLYQNKPARNASRNDAGGGEYWFSSPTNPADRFKLDENLLGNTGKFLKANEIVSALIWTDEDDEEKTIGLKLPIKMEFKVKEAPPAVRGDTSKSGNKIITLENGATLSAPMFINEGDTIRVNTETGEYVERA
jgi:elongation factor P